jgi:holliday junction DNA helicase RuvA
MISRIRGTLVGRHLDRAEVVTSGGVGYEMLIPLGVYERLPRPGEEVEVITRQIVREDAITLYGFLEEMERAVFDRLITAPGVGPKLALAMISSLSTDRLVRAVRDRETAVLTSVSGVGKKTAERLILDLAGKFDDLPVGVSGDGAGRAPGAEEAVGALTVLGYNRGDAERAVREAVEAKGTMPVEALVREAMARMR